MSIVVVERVRVTEHFYVDEFDCKDGTPYPREWVKPRLTLLCRELEIIRAALGGAPITVLSGYRTPEYNRSVGGEERSQHLEGRAADIAVRGKSVAEVVACIERLIADGTLVFVKGVGRYPPVPGKAGFVHVDVRPTKSVARWLGR